MIFLRTKWRLNMCNQRHESGCGHGHEGHGCGHEGHGCGHGGEGHSCGHNHGGHNHAEVFDKTYQDYLSRIKEIGLSAIAQRMGAEMNEDAVSVTLFGQEFLVRESGIEGPGGREPSFAEKVVLCKYFILYPGLPPVESEEFVSYRDFQDSAPFVGGFKENAELPIAKTFSGMYGALKKASAQIGGKDPELNLGYDITRVFQALPDIPLLLLFNDEDDEFPASAHLLFQNRAQRYLDMECLAILGWLLADRLAAESGACRHTIV